MNRVLSICLTVVAALAGAVAITRSVVFLILLSPWVILLALIVYSVCMLPYLVSDLNAVLEWLGGLAAPLAAYFVIRGFARATLMVLHEQAFHRAIQ